MCNPLFAGFAGLTGIGHGGMGGPPPYGQAPLAGLSPGSVNPFEGLAAQPFMGPGGHAGGDGAPDSACCLVLDALQI